ncbi:hypothetical protein [Thalassotalea atypica]|uniref:hypothetical protein n=1 Tax=Thalassotalea atypica TaxID=2054316 RepID=UPI00257445C4|nr:hypothetical protein [Thalassotalea atypica]
MSKTIKIKNFSISKSTAFQVFKYTIYLLIAYDIYHFFIEDYAASNQTYAGGVSPIQIIEAFTATIDTIAWLILLLLFELETYILEDEQIKGKVKLGINTLRALCYTFIVYSLYGFIAKFNLLHTTAPFLIQDTCSLIGSNFTYIKEIDKYWPITKEICQGFANIPLLQIVGTQIITDHPQLIEAQRLSTVEVTNSITWLLVVFILEVEVFLQLRGKLTERKIKLSKWIKSVLYAVLFLVAGYWGVKGGLLDFRDAFLWLVAFWFIEMNIFKWSEETTQAKASSKVTPVKEANK